MVPFFIAFRLCIHGTMLQRMRALAQYAPETLVCYTDCNTAAYECGVEKQQTYEILVADKNNHDYQHDLCCVVLIILATTNMISVAWCC